jgi:1-acyl-sn-glycerol-3-phosphate acyltransferase
MRQVRLWAASLLFNFLFFLVTAAFTVQGIWLLRRGHPDRLVGVGAAWARSVLLLLRGLCDIRVVVSGIEHIPTDGPAVIASIHQSAFDTCVWMLLPRPSYVLKRELLSLPGFGALMAPAGMIVVDRTGGGAAIRHLMRAGAAAAAEGRRIIIFPEGTRGRPGEARVLHPGVAALAAATKAPIIPVATNSGSHWGRRSFLKRPGVIRLEIGAPIAPDLGRSALLTAIEEAWERLETKLAEAVDKPVEQCREIF